MNEEAAKALRAEFSSDQIGHLPKGGTQLSYVGHAAVTDRLLQVDPEWTWEPVALAEDGAPLIRTDGKDASLWIRLTVAGTTRYGVGTASANATELDKQLISDAIRNAAMRFGVALDLWSKEDLAPAPPPPDPATLPAPKGRIELITATVAFLNPEQAETFAAWKADQGFPWPWTNAACDAIDAELARMAERPF